MADFDDENFTQRLLAETLFYDHEYGLIGNLSLVDIDARRERYIASFMPDDGTFLIEEATAWEDDPAMDDVPEAAAQALLALAREHDLLPSFTPLFEDEEL